MSHIQFAFAMIREARLCAIFIAIAFPRLHEEYHDIGRLNTVRFHMETCAPGRKKHLSPPKLRPRKSVPIKVDDGSCAKHYAQLLFPLSPQAHVVQSLLARRTARQSKRDQGCNQPCIVGFMALVKLFRKHGIWSEGTGCLLAQTRLHSQIVYQPSDGIMVGW
jgi:hypothetical protein